MKNFIKNILAFICLTSLMLACGEAETFTAQLVWSLSMLTICAVSGWGVTKLMTEEELNEKA